MTTPSVTRSANRWLLFSGLTALLVVLFLVLERPLSTLLMGMLLAAFAAFLSWRVYQSLTTVVFGRRLEASAVGRFVLQHPIALTHILAVCGVYLLVLSGQQFEPSINWDTIPQATVLLIVGGITLGGAMMLARHSGIFPDLPVTQQTWVSSVPLTRTHWLLAGGGVICLALLAEYNGQLLHTGLILSIHLQFGLWVAGIGLIVAGLGGLRLQMPRFSRAGARELAPLLLILLLALSLRLWNLENSVRFLVDELDFTDAILTLETETERPLLKPFNKFGGFSMLYSYVQAHMVNIFGHNFTGLRIANILIGTLHVAALYALARQLFDRTTAIMAAFLLATFPAHVHFSRLGLTELPATLCGTAGLAFLTRAIIKDQRHDYVIAGALLGMTHYFHEGGRLLYTPLAFVWLIGLWWMCRFRFSLRGVGWMALTLVLVALPNYYALYGQGFPLTNRLATTSIALNAAYIDEIRASGESMLLLREQLLAPMLMFVHGTDRSLFYLGNTALVIPLIVPLFLAGLCTMVWRWRQPGMLLLLIWLAATVAGNSLLVISTIVPRYIIVFAGIALIMAAGLRYISRLILPQQILSQRVYHAVIIGFTVTLAAAQIYYYFGEHIPTFNEQSRKIWATTDAQDAASRSVDFPDGTAIHIISSVSLAPNYAAGLLTYLTPDKNLSLDFLTPEEVTADYLAALDVSIDQAFYIESKDTATLERIREYFYVLPEQYSPYPYITQQAQFLLYYAPYIRGYSENRVPGSRPEDVDSAP